MRDNKIKSIFILMMLLSVGPSFSQITPESKTEVEKKTEEEKKAEAEKKAKADKKPEVEKKTLEQQETVRDFKSTQFLQLDSVAFPQELKIIEEEMKQNVVDVILSSNTHTPIFAQKREEGYTTSYTKFFGLKMTITPYSRDSNFYALKLFYYNWTTNKHDKEILRKISKFNVLNDIRFSIYELLNGKDYVRNNYDKIQKENFERIQGLRKVVEENERKLKASKKPAPEAESDELFKEELQKKKDKLMRKEREKERNPEYNFNPLEDNSDSTTSMEQEADEGYLDPKGNNDSKGKSKDGLNRPIRTNSERNNSKAKKSLNEDKKKGNSKDKEKGEKSDGLSLSDFNLIPGFSTPKKSSAWAMVSFFNEYNRSNGLLDVSTNLRYLGIGGKYNLEELTEKPRGLNLGLKIGMPLFKDEYEFPVYRSVETELYRRKILKHFMLIAGLDYTPVYNVNLPNAGADLQVFENDFLWLRGGIGVEGLIVNKKYSLKFEYAKAMLAISSQNVTLSGTKMGLTGNLQVYQMLGLELALARSTIGGDLDIQADTIQLSITYHFEN